MIAFSIVQSLSKQDAAVVLTTLADSAEDHQQENNKFLTKENRCRSDEDA